MAKIMLVEDDNNLREIYAARLQAEGYTVVSAKDGEEALVIAKAEKPDLIISDIMMPKISGFEMLDILHNTDGLRDVKVIMLTALGQSDDELQAHRLGADRYLVKSQVTLEDIVKVSRELLNSDGNAPAPAAGATPPATTPTGTEPAAAPPGGQDAATSSNAAQSDAPAKDAAADEVESFVAGATTDAPPPTSPPTPPPADTSSATTATPADTPTITVASIPVASPPPDQPATPDPKAAAPPPASPSPAAPPAEPATTVLTPAASPVQADDKLLNDAVHTLSPTSDSATVSPVAPDSGPAITTDSKRKKTVITPIDSQPKKDLTLLVAQEEAKTAAAAPPTFPPSQPTPPASPDPNSIAI